VELHDVRDFPWYCILMREEEEEETESTRREEFNCGLARFISHCNTYFSLQVELLSNKFEKFCIAFFSAFCSENAPFPVLVSVPGVCLSCW